MAIPKPHRLRAIAPPTTLPKPERHPRHDEIEMKVTEYICKTWQWPSLEEKANFCSWKLTDIMTYLFAKGSYERVELCNELYLLAFLMDGQSLADSQKVVARLYLLRDSPGTSKPLTNIEKMHHSIFTRILDQNSGVAGLSKDDVSHEQGIINKYMDMLACHCESDRGNLTSFQKYLVYREVDFGINMCSIMLYWTEEISLSPEEYQKLQPLERVANYHVMTLNDIFSFDKEWRAWQECGESAAMVNGVSILAGETQISVDNAKVLAFSLVRMWENEFKQMVKDLEDLGDLSNDEMKRAVRGIEQRVTGFEQYHWNTTRYQH